MTTPAAISATFSEWRMVKSRKVLQLVFELPLEKQGEVLAALGVPLPDAESWCAIARLKIEPTTAPSKSELGKQRYAASSDMERAIVRAARLPADERFQNWVHVQALKAGWGREQPVVIDEEAAINYLRNVCKVTSRREITQDAAAYQRFIAMESKYLVDSGLTPEPR
jgi:hypothetical protein